MSRIQRFERGALVLGKALRIGRQRYVPHPLTLDPAPQLAGFEPLESHPHLFAFLESNRVEDAHPVGLLCRVLVPGATLDGAVAAGGTRGFPGPANHRHPAHHPLRRAP